MFVCGPDKKSCSNWWNYDNERDMAANWYQAGLWWECFGDTLEDIHAKFVWEHQDNENVALTVPSPKVAQSVKLARLEVRNDYSYTDEELIEMGYFPPGDPSMNYIVANTDDAGVQDSPNGAPDGGYYVWTGLQKCKGDCFLEFEGLVIESEPVKFPDSYIKQ
mmetsp:Transcript_14914/g.27975  ORF Transcript_14914/g.27975 Transcript_14914/m.27975 type:complete len:163 (+) Transcript_14914:959-1447(+)